MMRFRQALIIYVFAFGLFANELIIPCQAVSGTIQPHVTLPFLKSDPIDRKLLYFDQIAGVYPPNVKSNKDLANVIEEWKLTEKQLTSKLSSGNESTDIELRLGHLYRFGHNVEIDGTWKISEAHFRKAITLSPSSVDAHIGLAILYVTSDPDYAAKAEPLFRQAIELSKGKDIPSAYHGLFFSYYFQGKVQTAIELANKYLAQHPEDEEMKHLREIAQTAIDRTKNR